MPRSRYFRLRRVVGSGGSNLADGELLSLGTQRNQTENRVGNFKADKVLLALDFTLEVEREERSHVGNGLHKNSSDNLF